MAKKQSEKTTEQVTEQNTNNVVTSDLGNQTPKTKVIKKRTVFGDGTVRIDN